MGVVQMFKVSLEVVSLMGRRRDDKATPISVQLSSDV